MFKLANDSGGVGPVTILDRDGGAAELLAGAGVTLVPLLTAADFDLS